MLENLTFVDSIKISLSVCGVFTLMYLCFCIEAYLRKKFKWED